MAQIEQSDKGGKKKKGAQKKMSIHVDFTPMVDMNMLLITFFMLCTTMIKSQTLQIILPAKVDPNKPIDPNKQSQVKSDRVITLLLDTEYNEKGLPITDENGNTKHRVYYYEGRPDSATTELKMAEYMANENGKVRGVRAIIQKKNELVMKKYNELKQRYAAKEISDAEFEAQALAIARDTNNVPATVIIKAGPNATYENVINAFDEVSLNQIRTYSFEHPNAMDSFLLRKYETATGEKVIFDNVRKAKK
ncbi:MAG: biopolymer transporter ExbD [Bacteroidales bacterium]|nr:biopolymer transporter ExbD [Bacteroidales bacterium]